MRASQSRGFLNPSPATKQLMSTMQGSCLLVSRKGRRSSTNFCHHIDIT